MDITYMHESSTAAGNGQPAAQSKLRELRQRAPLTAKVHRTICQSFAMPALCRSQLPEKRAYSWKLCVKWCQLPEKGAYSWKLSRLTWLVWDHLDTVSRKCKTTGILRWADFTLSHYLDPSLPHFCHTMNEKWPTDSVSHFCAEREGSYPLLK